MFQAGGGKQSHRLVFPLFVRLRGPVRHNLTPCMCERWNKSVTYRLLSPPRSCLRNLLLCITAVGFKRDPQAAVRLQKRATSDWLVLGQLTRAVCGSSPAAYMQVRGDALHGGWRYTTWNKLRKQHSRAHLLQLLLILLI